MTPQERYKRIQLVVRCLFWHPLLITGLLATFHIIPVKYLWWHAGILAAIICAIILYGLTCGLIVYTAFRFKPNPKSIFQRLAFYLWMKRMKALAPTLGPLVAFPYVVQLEVSKSVFEQEGLQAAQDAIMKWCDEMPNRMEKLITTLADMKKTKDEMKKEYENN